MGSVKQLQLFDMDIEDNYLHFMEEDSGDGSLHTAAVVKTAEYLRTSVQEVERSLERSGYITLTQEDKTCQQ